MSQVTKATIQFQMARSISGAHFAQLCRAACMHVVEFRSLGSLKLCLPHTSLEHFAVSAFSLYQRIPLKARDEFGAGAQSARNLQRHLCIYPSDKKICMKCFGKTLELVLLMDLIHVCSFIECFGCGILYVVSCRRARSYPTKSTGMLLISEMHRLMLYGVG